MSWILSGWVIAWVGQHCNSKARQSRHISAIKEAIPSATKMITHIARQGLHWGCLWVWALKNVTTLCYGDELGRALNSPPIPWNIWLSVSGQLHLSFIPAKLWRIFYSTGWPQPPLPSVPTVNILHTAAMTIVSYKHVFRNPLLFHGCWAPLRDSRHWYMRKD